MVTLDFVRGVAVLGILYANIVAFAHPMQATVWPGAVESGLAQGDLAVWLFQVLVIDGRMRGLFTLLFGAGMILFVDRAREKGAGVPLQVGRLGWLALFGLAHYFLLFRGDILFSYAVCGLLALVAVDWQGRTQLAVGLALFVAASLLSSLVLWPEAGFERDVLQSCAALPNCDGQDAETYRFLLEENRTRLDREAAILGSGTFGAILAENLGEHFWGPLDGAGYALFETLPLILVGMGLYRLGLFGPASGSVRIARLGLIGIVAGVVLNLPFALWLIEAEFPLFLSYFIYLGPAQIARLPMIMGLAAWLSWLAPRVAKGRLGRGLVAAGRMAFSNYLGTSLLMAAIFQGWGLALYGQFGRVELLAFVVLGWAVMLAWSAPWLNRFAYGPLEWLWRCLTYGKIFAFRRPDPSV